MGIDYNAYLVIGWPIEVPAEIEDSDEYLHPICKAHDLRYQTSGNAFSGDVAYHLTLKEPRMNVEPTPDDVVLMIGQAPAIARRLIADGIAIGPLVVRAVGYIW